MDNKKIRKSNSKNKIHLGAWEKLNIARLIERPTTLDYIEEIFDNFID